MRKIAILLVIVFAYVNVQAKRDYIPTKEEVQRFFKTKTYVVMEPNPLSDFNFRIKDIMKNHWTITEYEFITIDQFEEMRFDPNKSFLMVTQVKFDNDKTYSKYNFLSLMLGADVEELDQMPDLCPVPLSYASVDPASYVYKIGALVRFMQNHMEFIRENPDIITNNVFKHYNENMGDIQTKQLLVIKDELEPDINSIAKLKKYYPFDVKFVTREEVEQAINEERDDVVFLHKVGPEGSKLKARVYKIMIGAGDQMFYYFDYHMFNKSKKPDGLLKSDLKKMASKKPNEK